MAARHFRPSATHQGRQHRESGLETECARRRAADRHVNLAPTSEILRIAPLAPATRFAILSFRLRRMLRAALTRWPALYSAVRRLHGWARPWFGIRGR